MEPSFGAEFDIVSNVDHTFQLAFCCEVKSTVVHMHVKQTYYYMASMAHSCVHRRAIDANNLRQWHINTGSLVSTKQSEGDKR